LLDLNREVDQSDQNSRSAIEVLEKPDAGFVGFKWKETRKMFGKEATEIMWITDSVENEYFSTLYSILR